MKHSIFGLAKTNQQADTIVSRLQNEGFRSEYISILAYDRDNHFTRKNARGELEVNRDYFGNKEVSPRRSGAIGHEKHTKAPEGAATGATAGGLIGGGLGLLVGLGALAIPGFGPFIAAGPIMAALGGSAIGGAAGLLVGALAGLGLPEYEAKKIEKNLKEGHILICVEAVSSEELDRAKQILKQEGATDISKVGEASKSSR